MNCKFCGNFIPEGKDDTCTVCGRRDGEVPIGKLLSDNQPGTALQTTDAAEATEKTSSKKKHSKGLILPLLMIAASVAGWVYCLMDDVIGTLFSSVFSSLFKGVSGYEGGASAAASEQTGVVVVCAAAALLTLIGVAGVVLLLKRLYNIIKY